MNPLLLFVTIMSFSLNIAKAQNINWTSGRPDGHAPIGIMGDHYHFKGEWMFSYRYMPMQMQGNIQGNNPMANRQIFDRYMAVPQKMDMQMHMLGIMYAISNRITLAAMTNYIAQDMSLLNKMGKEFTTNANGIGDISVAALVKLLNANRQSLHLNIGLSIPTGNIEKVDNTPAGENMKLPYPMQLGSGTWDPLIGLTYLGQSENFSWGIQPKLQIRTGKNTEHYALGNLLAFNAWGALRADDWISFSVRGTYAQIARIKGADPELMPMMVTTANSNNSGRDQLILFGGSNFYISNGIFKNIRFGVEAGIPVYQYVEGIQMDQKWTVIAGLQYSFRAKEWNSGSN